MPAQPNSLAPSPDAWSRSRVVVAGFGLLSPLGQSAWETFSALCAGRSIADRCAQLPDNVAPVDLVRAVGAVRVAQHAGADPAVELAERAAREACIMGGVDAAGLPAFLGTSKGAVAAFAGTAREQPLAVTLGPHGYLAHKLRERLHVGVARHYVAACASSLTALHHALRSLSTTGDGPDHALVLAAEAALLPPFIHSYRRLGVLAPLTPEDYRERPLDARRRGFMLSELGAAVLLRRLPPGAEPDIGQIELVATDVACEANDLIRPSPRMEALSHVAARLFASLPSDAPLQMLHPHAPGTADHDPAELRVLLNQAPHARPEERSDEGPDGIAPPDLYACKGALGHGLGAAGLTALVLACLCLTAGRRPPMPWLDEPIAGLPDLKPHILRPCARTGAHAVFSAGFAGHVAGALIQRW